ncbi:HIRAN domain-containing protein [Enteractinococcus coprophilus]|uniref:HIRAN domain-containing protein n=2 Tax=Enteractinococcus coprophilus TaxID=1027633 RepID=A0A543AJK4_9MICC|nr:HIRAN domain-containing protein [Enteractinococcus coprophilus]
MVFCVEIEPRIYCMTLFFLALAIVVIIYLLRTRNKRQADSAGKSTTVDRPHREGAGQTPDEGSFGITIHHREIPSVAIDLRHDAERVFRVVGSSHWVDPDTMGKYVADYFFLHREPENEYDTNAVAVYGGDRKFGYLKAAAAAEYAPLFDQIGSDFIVARDQIYYGGDQFRLPHIPILRKMLEDGQPPYWHPKS